MREVQTFKTEVPKADLIAHATKLGYSSVGELINTAVIGLLAANGIKPRATKDAGDNKQMKLPGVLSEKTRRKTVEAFQATYDSHHKSAGKSPAKGAKNVHKGNRGRKR